MTTAPASCEWTEDADGNYWTSCANAFQMTTGTPAENDFKFCPFCGRSLVEVPFAEEA